MEEHIPHPPIAGESEWRAARVALLDKEKELTKHGDRVAAERRRLPMVKVEKDYVFDSPDGPKRLFDLFEGQRQLVVYHFMFDPKWDRGCGGCTNFMEWLGDLSKLAKHDTTFALVSRAPLEKLEAYRKEKGWNVAWYSSFGSDFNYDYHATLDPEVAPMEYNYRPFEWAAGDESAGEAHALSVFFRLGEDVYHTYSAFARGVESIANWVYLLDVTPYSRQEDWQDSPPGWPQQPTYG